MRISFIALMALAVPSVPVCAQPPSATAQPKALSAVAQAKTIALEPNEGRAVAEKLASELLKTFVLPDQARAYAAMLRTNAAAGRYDAGTRGALAELLTHDLLAVKKDGHLTVMLADPEEQKGGSNGPPKDFPPLIQSAKWIAPGIAYIRPTAFMSNDEEIQAFRSFMSEHREAKTIIFDMRNHHGGRLGEMDVIFPYLFAAKTPLVRMEMARSIYDEFGSPFGQGGSLEFVKNDRKVTATHYALPGEETPLRQAKVYLLVSNKTASAGEHFSQAMKSSGRATLIGEATAGANHFGGPAPLNDHFAVWMPVGRTYDMKTGEDWEGHGVAPDIAVDPKQALVVALEKAGLSHTDAQKLDAQEIPSEPVHADTVRAR